MTGSSRRNSTRSRIKPAAEAGDDQSGSNVRSNVKPRSQREKDQSLLRIINASSKAFIGLGSLAALIAVLLIFRLVNTVEEPEKPRVVTPFPAPKLMDLPMVKHSFVN
ncbi:hypothetical protein ACH5RR_035474 [Cinchona calisaya]|uniref:Uncharacterized protein n=1 Tax=Cinchona calisaya TaxID=153742 RepID=A0ABD2Y5D2_9GENT